MGLDEKTLKALREMGYAEETPEEAEESRRPERIMEMFKHWVEDIGYKFHPPFHEVKEDEHGQLLSAINMPAYAERMQGTSRKMLFLYMRENGAVMQADVIGHNGQSHPVGWPALTEDGECVPCNGECGWVTDINNETLTLVLENQHQIPWALSQIEIAISKAIDGVDGFYLISGY